MCCLNTTRTEIAISPTLGHRPKSNRLLQKFCRWSVVSAPLGQDRQPPCSLERYVVVCAPTRSSHPAVTRACARTSPSSSPATSPGWARHANGARTRRTSRFPRWSVWRASSTRPLNARSQPCRLAPQLLELLGRPLDGPDQQPARFPVFGTVSAAFLLREALRLCLAGKLLADLTLLLDDHVSALGHAEGLLEQAEMIELGPRRMLEGLEPGGMHEIGDFHPVNQEGILLHGVAHLVGVFGAVGRLGRSEEHTSEPS